MPTLAEATGLSGAVRAGPSVATHERRGGRLAAGLLLIGAGLAATALLGPLVTGVIDYRVTETLRNQTIGLDAVSLAVVAPLCVVAALMVLRDRVAGPAVALGVGAYTSYMFVQYILGPDHTGLAGSNEKAFPLYLVLFAAGWIVALAAWSQIDPKRIPGSRSRDLLVGRVILPVLAFLAFVRYLPGVAEAMSATPTDEGYLAGPAFYWAIAMLDLGVFLPVTIATCFGLLRGSVWAPKALYLVAGWFALVGVAVAAMAITMQINDDPNASAASTVLMTALGVAFTLLAIYVYRPLLRKAAQPPQRPRRSDEP